MDNIYSPKFDRVRGWIRSVRDQGWSWEEIRTFKNRDKKQIELTLVMMQAQVFFVEFTLEEWYEIVSAMKDVENREQELQEAIMVTDKNEDNDATVPIDPKSSWVLYKKYLVDSNWNKDSINEIEKSTIRILRRLNLEEGTPTVKGMVVGYVQSGKTANMAALMAMAADWGCNMFIVLSGTIENLRKQTQDRLFKDLNHQGNLVWREINHPSPQSESGEKLQNLNLSRYSNRRYFTVCLKNSKRLEDLIKWLQSDLNKLQQLKIIVIDDEADQGGVNTANISANERSKINKLIVNLVEGNRPDGSPFSDKPACMNYIGYTATPYANFLNESERESLYPRNFIRALVPSKEYIGAKQIFGLEGTEEYQGMNIVRIVPKDELELVKSLHKNERLSLPPSLMDALLWFLCAASAMRRSGYKKKAISMLVHTSQKQVHHDYVAHAIINWLKTVDLKELLEGCREIWDRETSDFTKSDFQLHMPDYPSSDQIKDYPQFDDLLPYIKELVSEISHIPLNEDGQLNYHKGIHVCIDNCSYNAGRDEEVYVRLAYPDPSSGNYPDPAPVFIVVGGSTLSRGLTIEGLVSTYFLRAANQADSLMQMGRWFGYRRGYELYPRIWMTEDTRSKFEFLTLLEEDLRDDLRRFMDANEDPSVYGPRVLNSPKVSWLRITSKNKMQSAEAAELDFSGTNAQTVVFSKDEEVLLKNIEIADEFLASLGNGTSSFTGDSLVWRGISFETIKESLLTKMKFHPKAVTFNQIDAFCDWYVQAADEAGFESWNVVVAGTKPNDLGKVWKIPGGVVGKINRSKKKRQVNDNSVNIGVLRAPKDLFEDIEPDIADGLKHYLQSGTKSNKQVREIRELAGLGKTPQLILYRIDKDSKAQKDQTRREEKPGREEREDLDVSYDIIGVSLWIPGVAASKSLEKRLTVKITITNEQIDIDDETGEELGD